MDPFYLRSKAVNLDVEPDDVVHIAASHTDTDMWLSAHSTFVQSTRTPALQAECMSAAPAVPMSVPVPVLSPEGKPSSAVGHRICGPSAKLGFPWEPPAGNRVHQSAVTHTPESIEFTQATDTKLATNPAVATVSPPLPLLAHASIQHPTYVVYAKASKRQ